MSRKLSESEEQAVRLLVAGLNGFEREKVLSDLSICTVEKVTKDGSRLQFVISNYKRPKYSGQHSYNVGGALKDADGTEVGVNLYADENHRLFELELIRWGAGPLIEPDWNSFRVQY